MVGLAVLAAASAIGTAAAPAWDVSGTWRGAPGNLTIVQAGSALRGTFAMTVGCTARYAATGSISGGAVRLTLTFTAATSGRGACAARQTLAGTVSKSGTSMSLVLANARQVSPPTPFRGRAQKLTGG